MNDLAYLFAWMHTSYLANMKKVWVTKLWFYKEYKYTKKIRNFQLE